MGQSDVRQSPRLNPYGALAPEGMNCSGTGDGRTPVPGPFRNEILFSGSDWNALAIDNQCITALQNDEVFVVLDLATSRLGQAIAAQAGMRCPSLSHFAA